MVNQRHCPFCKRPAKEHCEHLALAVPGRDFVRCCIDAAQAHRQWNVLCQRVHTHNGALIGWNPDREDFTWLETAFCDRFLKNLRWFTGIDYEWRTGEQLERGGFYVLLWSPCPQRLWWELLDHIGRQAETLASDSTALTPPWGSLVSFDGRQMSLGDRA